MNRFSISTVLVDDEEPARDRMRRLLADFEQIQVVGEASNGEEALQLIRRERPHLVFLDIQMPGLSGIEVATRLEPPRPDIIYCTAYEQYAVEAFEQHAVDYLLKPVTRQRLSRAVERVRQEVKETSSGWDSERADAAETQERLLPRELPQLSALDYAAACRPARGVGGDYYDFFAFSPDRLDFVLADVSGKGMPAALLMAGLQGRLQSEAPRHRDDLAALTREVNRLMWQATDGCKYVTLFYGAFDGLRRELRYVNAGHNAPMKFRLGRGEVVAVERLDAGGTVLGLFPDQQWVESRTSLGPDELLVVFTDGVSEAMNPAEEEYGEERLTELVRAHSGEDAGALIRLTLAEIESHVGGAPAHDDLTLIVAKGR